MKSDQIIATPPWCGQNLVHLSLDIKFFMAISGNQLHVTVAFYKAFSNNVVRDNTKPQRFCHFFRFFSKPVAVINCRYLEACSGFVVGTTRALAAAA